MIQVFLSVVIVSVISWCFSFLLNLLEGWCMRFVHRWGPQARPVIRANQGQDIHSWAREEATVARPGADGMDTGCQQHHRQCPATAQFPTSPPHPSLTATPPPHWVGSRPIGACRPAGGTRHRRLAASPEEGANPQPPWE